MHSGLQLGFVLVRILVYMNIPLDELVCFIAAIQWSNWRDQLTS
jgi:hypothetical protein